MNKSKVDFTPDPATSQHVLGDTLEAVALVGYFGEGRDERTFNLYETVALERWIEIARDDIVARESASGERSVIWVQRDAVVVRAESLRASCFEAGDGLHGSAWPKP